MKVLENLSIIEFDNQKELDKFIEVLEGDKLYGVVDNVLYQITVTVSVR